MEATNLKEMRAVAAVSLLGIVAFGLIAGSISMRPVSIGWLIAAAVAGIMWLAGQAMALALVKNKIGTGVLIALPVLSALLAGGMQLGAVAGGLLLLAALVMAKRAFTKEISNRIKYTTVDVFGPGTKVLILGLVLVIGGLALPSLQSVILNNEIQVSEKQIDLIIRPIEPMLQGLVPGFSNEDTLDDIIDQRIDEEISNMPAGTEVSDAERARMHEQAAKQFGNNVNGSDSMAKMAAEQINRMLANLTQNNALIAAGALVLSLFLTIRMLIPLFAGIVIALLIPAIWLARKEGLIELREKEEKVERLGL